MLYKKNDAPSLTDELFRNPTSEYRGTPFWAWNSDLSLDELERQIDIFKKMGLGGFHMHVRTGMSTPYLTDEFMALIRGCTEKAKKEKMLAWLYDEDRWPSGAAGGYVTRDEQYRARCLLFTPVECDLTESDSPEYLDSRAEGGRNGKGHLIACYDVELDNDGFLKNYSVIGKDDAAKGTKWYAYLKIHASSPWYNNQSYVNTLDKKAIDRFIEVTHENYRKTVGDEFDKTIPAIFTDEPQFTRKKLLENSTDLSDIIMPWTDDLPETYSAAYGEDLLASLPEIFWELPDGKTSLIRYHYHDHIAERFTEAFADNCGAWCRKNKIALTGHMMEEPTLRSQTAALGEAMRSYKGFDIPGIDMLCANFEFTTAKQTQSAVHQFGCEAMLSELYGVTGWDYDFRGYKLHGDWQACLGVTVRVPHLSWYAMGGEAKRDYPASIHYQSPWWQEFSYVENHFGRVNTAMTRGKPVVKVGVIHPVESFWLHWGPNDKTALIRECMDEKFKSVTEWLLKGSVDFDFISESLLPEQCSAGGAPLKVGKMAYDAVIVPECETLRSTTLERLEAFEKAGGKLIFMGSAPTLCDGKESDRGSALHNASVVIPYDREKLLTSLDEFRTVTLRLDNGRLSDSFIYQLRKDNDCNWLFVSRCREPYNKCVVDSDDLRITVNGEFTPIVYDTLNGNIYDIPCEYKNGNTIISKRLYNYDSLLLKLVPGRRNGDCAAEQMPEYKNLFNVPAAVPYTLSEKNVLLLDCAEYALDGGDFAPEEEILRLDNVLRERCGFSSRGGHVAQPWVIEKEIPEHTVTLRFNIESEIEYSGALLALEDAETAKISFNGADVPSETDGWFTDKDIKCIALPDIRKGKNVLTITWPFGRRTNTEWCYILGDFGVYVAGRLKKISTLPDKLAFGDIVTQGLAFYGGNVTYHLDAPESPFTLETTRYSGTLVGVSVDGNDAGRIVYPPYKLALNGAGGTGKLDITLFGNRFNCFGAVHNCDDRYSWHGPGAWRTENDRWCYEYVLRKIGILSSPVIRY